PDVVQNVSSHKKPPISCVQEMGGSSILGGAALFGVPFTGRSVAKNRRPLAKVGRLARLTQIQQESNSHSPD
ncbi:hypothetical protein, partial [Parolsenella catena]